MTQLDGSNKRSQMYKVVILIPQILQYGPWNKIGWFDHSCSRLMGTQMILGEISKYRIINRIITKLCTLSTLYRWHCKKLIGTCTRLGDPMVGYTVEVCRSNHEILWVCWKRINSFINWSGNYLLLMHWRLCVRWRKVTRLDIANDSLYRLILRAVKPQVAFFW